MNYNNDRTWSDRYIPELKRIVGPLLLEEAPLDLDTEQATDLIVFRARDMRIGCRVRRYGYADKYPNDFTIRAKRSNGTKTELRKIAEGWGDWLVYAHAKNTSEPELERWMVVDLHRFRYLLITDHYTKRRAHESNYTPNQDRTTWFASFDITLCGGPILVAQSNPIQVAA